MSDEALVEANESRREAGVGVVVIGRNEGERLERCLRSVAGNVGALVYVDSGSTDQSVSFARSMGASVVVLDRSSPFTAARARNDGFERLRQMSPAVELVQFVDGDCELEPGWIASSCRAFDADPSLGAVCGHLRERDPGASIYNRLADVEWKRPVGDVGHCGGVFMARARVFEETGGFNPSIAAGEEPDLCCRVRDAGYRVVRIDAPMARHDLNMTRFSQWWRRSVRGGYGALQLTLYGPTVSRGIFRRQVRSVVTWMIALPLLTLTGAGIAALLGAGVWSLGVLILWPAAMILQAARLAFHARRQGFRAADAAAHGGFTMMWKCAALTGFARCLLDRWRSARPVREFLKTAE